MKEIIVNKKYNGKKLDVFLYDNFNGLTKNIIYKTLRKKDIRINDKRVGENIILNEGDVLKVFLTDAILYKKPAFDMIYEDENILIVNKPSDVEVVGENSLTTALQKNYSYQGNSFPLPCHRLDRNTSGLVLYAKNKESLDILSQKFKQHEIEKKYITKVYGIPQKEYNTIVSYLFKDSKKSLVYISDTPKIGYRKIITSYKVLEKNEKENTSILEVTLHTGRTHQIRAHLAYLGYPIIGDGKYGNNDINKQFKIRTQMLYSYSLEFKFVTSSDPLDYLDKEIFQLDINNLF